MRRGEAKWAVAAGLALAVLTACSSTSKSSGASPQPSTYTPTPTPTPIPGCTKTPAATPNAPSTSTQTGTATVTGTGTGTGNGISTAPSTIATGTSALAGTSLLDATGGTASWNDVKTIIQNSCLGSCHRHDALVQYQNAVDVAQQMVQRTDVDPSDPSFMPQGGGKLALADREKLVLWVNSGTPNDLGASADAAQVTAGGNGTAGTASDPGTPSGQSRFALPKETAPATSPCGS